LGKASLPEKLLARRAGIADLHVGRHSTQPGRLCQCKPDMRGTRPAMMPFIGQLPQYSGNLHSCGALHQPVSSLLLSQYQ